MRVISWPVPFYLTLSALLMLTSRDRQVPTAGTKPVLLIVSLEGIKVCGPEGKVRIGITTFQSACVVYFQVVYICK